jgi:hypothetical protein
MPRLAERARARAGAMAPLARHLWWARWSSIGAAVLIAAVIARVAVFSPGGSALWSGVSSSAVSAVNSTGSQISASLQWMLMGLAMVAMCILVLSIWRLLAAEEGNGYSLAAEGW